jgi:NAD-dependent dihydropyrimidine dehydrogenase PreA subunit
MKKRYQMSIIFEVEGDDESKCDDEAKRCEEICFSVVSPERGNETFEDMVWVVDENDKCIGSL